MPASVVAARFKLRPLHDRLPVILLDDKYDQWLEPKCDDTSKLGELLKMGFRQAAMCLLRPNAKNAMSSERTTRNRKVASIVRMNCFYAVRSERWGGKVLQIVRDDYVGFCLDRGC